ncbi:MAG: carboxypeptidase-like regulatory domain-containing protein [Bacteroidales bacterium]|nr:carboxypeptidase-like regulatory domain-containing protein [Bacteroidales bacterium]
MIYSHDDYNNATGEDFTLANGDNLDIDYSLEPLPGSLSGIVIDANTSNPVPNAEVTAVNDNIDPPETLFTVVTDASGEYYVSEVPSGTWEIVATSGNHNEGSVTETITANQLTEASDIVLTPLPGISEGTVREEGSNELLSDVTVNILGAPGYDATTDNNGFYQIEDVPVGTYDVEFSKTGYDTYTEEDVTIVSLTATTISPYLEQVGGSLMVRINNLFEYSNHAATVTIGSEYVAEYINTNGSNGDGYQFSELPPGIYDVLVEHDNYHSYIIEDVEIVSGGSHVEHVSLTPYNWEHYQVIRSSQYGHYSSQTVTIDGEPVEANDEIGRL